jgi:hypothetical protein
MIAEMERKKAEMEEIVGRLRGGGGVSKVN